MAKYPQKYDPINKRWLIDEPKFALANNVADLGPALPTANNVLSVTDDLVHTLGPTTTVDTSPHFNTYDETEPYPVPERIEPMVMHKTGQRLEKLVQPTNTTDHADIPNTTYPEDSVEELPFKYNEAEIMKELNDHLLGTYGEHYVKDDSKLECFDAWIALGDSGPTFRNTALKYLWRYGKKDGKNKDDLLKAMHYIQMLMHVEHYKK